MTVGERVEDDIFDQEESVQMDFLIEEWEKYVEEILPFNLIPRDFFGVLDERILGVVKDARGKGVVKAIEAEYTDLKDVYAEQIYIKYSSMLYEFFRKMGFKRKTDPRAEVGQNDEFFWNIFMNKVKNVAVENVWDLFDYEVALVRSPTMKLNFAKSPPQGGKIHYTVVKDANYQRLLNDPLVKQADRILDRMNGFYFTHPGDGFTAIFVRGSEIVLRAMEGEDNIPAHTICVGIHDWETGEGTVQFIKKDVCMPLSDCFVDSPETGVILHRPGRRAMHVHKKVV